MALPWRQDVWQDDFSNFLSARYRTGSATSHDAATGRMILVPAQPSRTGRILLRRPLHIASFDASFRASFGVNSPANSGGGDGMVFIFGPVDDYPETGGGTLGFNGSLGYGVELDTYQNPELGDPNHEHVAVIKDVSSNHLISELLAVPTIEDGRTHTFHIRLRAGTIIVWIDGVQRLSHTPAGLDPFDGFLGFSAACGAAFNEHALDEIRVAMPSRMRTEFGPLRICDPVTIDTFLTVTNEHDFGGDLTITAIALTSATPGIITLPSNPVPSVLPWRGNVRLPLRFSLPGEGVWQAVLRLDSDGGETVYDTLRVSAFTQRLAWSIPALSFPPQPVGSLRDTVVFLKNTGMVEAEVSDVLLSSHGVTLSGPAGRPFLIAPGDSVGVRISVRPGSAGPLLDSLRIVAPCGLAPVLPVSAAGVQESIAMGFTRPALMLNPGRQGTLELFLDSLPEFSALYVVEGEFTFATPELRYDGVVFRGSALPAAATLTATEPIPGRIAWRASSAAPLRDTGTLAVFELTADGAQQVCLDVVFERGEGNAGVPGEYPLAVAGRDGLVCINTSCRHPEGLRLTSPLDVRVHPNPVTDHSTITLEAPEAGMVDVRIRDLLGREHGSVFTGWIDKGTLVLPLAARTLPAGVLFLIVERNGEVGATGFVVRK